MKNCFLIAGLLLFISCTQSTGIKKTLIVADSVAINYFKGNGTADSVVKMVMIKNKNQVIELSNFIDDDIVHTGKCGFDGTIHFFMKDMVLKDIGFRYNDPSCMHFSFTLGGKHFCTKLSGKAKNFLSSFNK